MWNIFICLQFPYFLFPFFSSSIRLKLVFSTLYLAMLMFGCPSSVLAWVSWTFRLLLLPLQFYCRPFLTYAYFKFVILVLSTWRRPGYHRHFLFLRSGVCLWGCDLVMLLNIFISVVRIMFLVLQILALVSAAQIIIGRIQILYSDLGLLFQI